MKKRHGFFLAALLGSWAFGAIAQDTQQATPSAAEGEAASAPAGPFWLMSCSNQGEVSQLLCEFSQSLVVTQGGQSQRVATAAFSRVAGSTELDAAFLFPYGVSLPAGVSVSVDGADVASLTWQSCDINGCYATGDVDQTWIDAMRSGSQMSTALTDTAGRELNFAFQLTGFDDALEMLP